MREERCEAPEAGRYPVVGFVTDKRYELGRRLAGGVKVLLLRSFQTSQETSSTKESNPRRKDSGTASVPAATSRVERTRRSGKDAGTRHATKVPRGHQQVTASQ